MMFKLFAVHNFIIHTWLEVCKNNLEEVYYFGGLTLVRNSSMFSFSVFVVVPVT